MSHSFSPVPTDFVNSLKDITLHTALKKDQQDFDENNNIYIDEEDNIYNDEEDSEGDGDDLDGDGDGDCDGKAAYPGQQPKRRGDKAKWSEAEVYIHMCVYILIYVCSHINLFPHI